MGIYSRDYYREPEPAGPLLGSSRGSDWALKYLLIANVAVFLLQAATQPSYAVMTPQGIARASSPVTEWLSLSLANLESFQVWRLVTYGFCHGSLNHLLFNMLALWVFGRVVEPIYGSIEFLSFYLAAVTFSGCCHVLLQLVESSPSGVVGASGGVMAVVFLTAMVYPRMTVLLMMFIPIQLRWLAVLYLAFDMTGMVQGGTGISHAAHLGGAAFGIAYRYFGWSFSNLLARHVRPRNPATQPFQSPVAPRKPRPQVRIFDPAPDDLEEQVDRILAKISEHGEASLTDDERATLKAASRRASQRLRGD